MHILLTDLTCPLHHTVNPFVVCQLHHGVRIRDEALIAAAMLSNRYITERFLPDKAIDLVDEAAAKLNIEISSKPQVMDDCERRLLQLQMERLSIARDSSDASETSGERMQDDARLKSLVCANMYANMCKHLAGVTIIY